LYKNNQGLSGRKRVSPEMHPDAGKFVPSQKSGETKKYTTSLLGCERQYFSMSTRGGCLAWLSPARLPRITLQVENIFQPAPYLGDEVVKQGYLDSLPLRRSCLTRGIFLSP
jgi:hypothetical protein